MTEAESKLSIWYHTISAMLTADEIDASDRIALLTQIIGEQRVQVIQLEKELARYDEREKKPGFKPVICEFCRVNHYCDGESCPR